MFQLEVVADSVTFAIIYRPPQPNSAFLKEFAEFLGGAVIKFENILLLGDFNIHICCQNKPLPRDFCYACFLCIKFYTMGVRVLSLRSSVIHGFVTEP